MGRRNDHGVKRLPHEFRCILRREGKAKTLFHLLQFGFAQAANGCEFDIITLCENGNVIGRRPPSGANKSKANAGYCHFGFPRYCSDNSKVSRS
jgi:hypothetical protein